jgi:hypothetical protein
VRKLVYTNTVIDFTYSSSGKNCLFNDAVSSLDQRLPNFYVYDPRVADGM